MATNRLSYGFLCLALAFFSCANPIREEQKQANRLQNSLAAIKEKKMSPKDELAAKAALIEQDKSAAALRNAIAKEEKRLNQALAASQNIGRTRYLLGLKYVDYQMYGEALNSFKEAIKTYPQNGMLYYYAGVCLGQLAQTAVSEAERQAVLDEALAFQQQAYKFEPDQADVMLALSALYAYYFDQNEEAAKIMSRYAQANPKNITGLWLRAYIAASLGQRSQAASLYLEISRLSGNAEEKQKAQSNYQELLAGTE